MNIKCQMKFAGQFQQAEPARQWFPGRAWEPVELLTEAVAQLPNVFEGVFELDCLHAWNTAASIALTQ